MQVVVYCFVRTGQEEVAYPDGRPRSSTLFVLSTQTMYGDAVSLKKEIHGDRDNPEVYLFAPQSEGNRVRVLVA